MTVTLEDLVIKKGVYRVERVLRVTEDPLGNYKAESPEDVERALTDGHPAHSVFVRMGPNRNWFPVEQPKSRPTRKHRRRRS